MNVAAVIVESSTCEQCLAPIARADLDATAKEIFPEFSELDCTPVKWCWPCLRSYLSANKPELLPSFVKNRGEIFDMLLRRGNAAG